MNSGSLFERSAAGAPCCVTSFSGWSVSRSAVRERSTSPPMRSRVCSSMMEQILIAGVELEIDCPDHVRLGRCRRVDGRGTDAFATLTPRDPQALLSPEPLD